MTSLPGRVPARQPSGAPEGGRRSPDPLSSRLTRWGVAAWSLIGMAVLGYAVIRYVVAPVRVVFGPLLVAVGLVQLLNPVVSALERRRVPRVAGAIGAYLVLLAALGVSLRFLIPVLAHQVSSFAGSVPALLDRTQSFLDGVNARLDLHLDTAALIRDLGPQGGAGEFISRIFGLTASVLRILVVFLIGAVLGLYVLIDLPSIRRTALSLLPVRRRDDVRTVLAGIGRTVGGYVRGSLLVALFVGLASMLALWVVGLPYWAMVGLVAGLFNLVPMIGPYIGAVPALFIALTCASSEGLLHLRPGWPLAVGALGALLLVQQIDNNLVSPNVLSRTVKLHPITVMLGLLVGGTAAGLWGMLLAVPVVASAKVVLLHVWDTRMQWPPAPERDLEEPRPPPVRRRGAG